MMLLARGTDHKPKDVDEVTIGVVTSLLVAKHHHRHLFPASQLQVTAFLLTVFPPEGLAST